MLPTAAIWVLPHLRDRSLRHTVVLGGRLSTLGGKATFGLEARRSWRGAAAVRASRSTDGGGSGLPLRLPQFAPLLGRWRQASLEEAKLDGVL